MKDELFEELLESVRQGGAILRKMKPRFVRCIKNKDYPASLKVDKVYAVITNKEIEAQGELYVVDESGEAYIYPADYFIPEK